MALPRRVGVRLLATLLALAPWTVHAADELDVQGHQGCRGLRPGNTLPAFEKALELRVTTLELDLQVTRDRQVVVYHDQHVSGDLCRYDDGRPAPKQAFKDLDLADLATLDCGAMRDARHPEQEVVPGARIPSLAQVLQLARRADYPVRVSVEIKRQNARNAVPIDEFARLVLDVLAEHEMRERTIVQSFDPAILRVVRELDPEIDLAVLVRKPGRYDAALEESGATILSPKHTALRKDDVRRMQARGVPVIPWTVNAPADIRRLLAWGVEGIISDYPDRVIAIRDGG